MTLSDLYDRLESHDWFYHMSDDHGVWIAGERDSRELKALAESIPGGMDLFNAYGAHIFSGKPFSKPQQPKPERPV